MKEMKLLILKGLALVFSALLLVLAGCSITTNYYSCPEHKTNKKTEREMQEGSAEKTLNHNVKANDFGK